MTHRPVDHLRDYGLFPGIYPTGPTNSISDVAGVLTGHFTLIDQDICSGATAIFPHPGNIFQDKVPAGIAVINGFGKLTGSTQVMELGEIETPIVLTNTLAVPRAADAILDWVLRQPGNEAVVSVNPLVAETNDAFLNNIRKRPFTQEMISQALDSVSSAPPAEGAVGAGAGTTCFGWKGGIGSSSRQLPADQGGWLLGALVQTNFGGRLTMLGVPIWKYLQPENPQAKPAGDNPGSVIVVLATDAPLSDRNLRRLGQRAVGGLARCGASLSNGSGDYAIAFSTNERVRRTPQRRSHITEYPELSNDRLSPLFAAVIELVEEAVYNSLTCAVDLQGYLGHRLQALPIKEVVRLIQAYR